MNATDYEAVLHDTLAKMGAVRKDIDQLEIEAAKLRQLFFATLNMLPDSHRNAYLALLREFTEAATIREASLKDAIYKVLVQSSPKYLTTAEVRDRLRAGGFDFTDSTSNQ